ncbi:hypothetical protein HDU99_009863, partial [Rhizoclosmatium hyalinum]
MVSVIHLLVAAANLIQEQTVDPGSSVAETMSTEVTATLTTLESVASTVVSSADVP